MTTDKAIHATGEDVLKLRIVHALASAALKTGQTFDQFAAAVEAAGVMPPSNGRRDCTDLRMDAEKLGIVMDGSSNPEPLMRQVLDVLARIEARLSRTLAG